MATLETIDTDRFRTVLGSYPTGVAIVTCLDAGGSPLGLVVGSFTSVSLDPPLVAFLPMRSSRTFEAMRAASSGFCVNVLAADQEALCNAFASAGADKFATLPWRQSPAGNPLLDGVVAWIDCDYANVVDGGDHHIVLGRVKAMQLERDTPPLLYFQRCYGRFVSNPVRPGGEHEALRFARLAESARDEIERLATELKAECSVIASVGDDAVYVAVAHHDEHARPHRHLGLRTPLVPPLGTLFVGQPGAPTDDAWLARLGKVDVPTLERSRQQLERVRARGWSLTLHGSVATDELEQAVSLYTDPQRTPEQLRRFLSTLKAMSEHHEPSIDEAARYDVMHLSVPVRNPAGDVVLVLRLGDLERGVLGGQVHRWQRQLAAAAGRIETRISGLPECATSEPASQPQER